MVIRFNDTIYRAAELRDAINWCYVNTIGPEGCIEDGVEYTPFVIKQHIYLLDNYDLFIDDDFDLEIAGMFMHTLRSRGFLEEKSKTIIPRVFKDTTPCVPPVHMTDTDIDEDDNIEYIEDYFPDSYWDDGKFEEEMEEIHNSPDLYKD